MTVMQSARPTKPAIEDDPWLSIDQLLEKYPFFRVETLIQGDAFIGSVTSGIFHSTMAGPADSGVAALQHRSVARRRRQSKHVSCFDPFHLGPSLPKYIRK